MMKRIGKGTCISSKREPSGTCFTKARSLKQQQRVHTGKKSSKCKQGANVLEEQ